MKDLTDLIGSSSSYQERYLLFRNEINTQMEQYVMCSEDFNEIQQEVNELESDTYDTIVPCTECVAEGDNDLHPDLNERYNLSDDLGIPSVDLNSEPLLLNELQDESIGTWYKC